MKSNYEGINVPVQYFGSLGPWIVEIFKDFAMSDLDVTDFGPKHCQIIQDESNIDCEDSAVKVITDGEFLINAMFTLSSLHNFNQRFINESTWQKKVLMLEKFKITHVAGVSQIGDILIKVEKFCCVGEPKYTADKFPFQLYWAITTPVVKQACQEIWENKLLDGADGTLEFSEITSCNNTAITSMNGNSFLHGIRSARNILIASNEERQILRSIPGWSEECSKNVVKERFSLSEETKSSKDAVSEKRLIKKFSNNNQANKGNQVESSSLYDEINKQTKNSNFCINKETSKTKIISPGDSQINRTVCETKVQRNMVCLIPNRTSQNSGSCVYSLIKQNFEREEQRLMNLQQSNYPFVSACFNSNISIATNNKSAPFNLLKLQDDFPLESDIHYSGLHQHMKRHARFNDTQNSKNDLHLHKTALDHKIDSVLNFLQDESLDNFCHSSKGDEYSDRCCANSDQFHTQYCTPLLQGSKENSFESRSYFNENGIFTNTKINGINAVALSTKNKSKVVLKDSCPSRAGSQKRTNVSDHSPSKMTTNSLIKAISPKNVKRLKISHFLGEESSEEDFAKDISHSQAKDCSNKTCSVQSSDTCNHFSHVKKMEECPGNVNLFPVNASSPNETSQAEVASTNANSRIYQGSNPQIKAELPYFVQRFNWSFTKVHIEAMWSKMVELFVEKSNQMQKYS